MWLVRVLWGLFVLFFKLLQLFELVACFGVRDGDTDPYFEPDRAGGWPAAILNFPVLDRRPWLRMASGSTACSVSLLSLILPCHQFGLLLHARVYGTRYVYSLSGFIF